MNLKELSQMLGLSQTTISRALNGYPEVNKETRERVLQAARETGYRPNRAAQRLATGKAGSIGLIMPISPDHSSDMHFAEFQSGLAEASIVHDFHFVIMPSRAEDEEQAIRWLVASGSVDGYYLAYVRDRDPRITMAKSLSLPFIVHGRSFGLELDYPFLDVDNEGAFYDATRFLLQLGHQRFALLNGPSDLDFAHRRRLGTEKALAEKGLLLDPRHTRHSFMGDEQGYRGMKEILASADRPTAVLCASTVLALGAVRAMNEVGLKLGTDISLIAHDDELPLLKPENFSIPLTTTRSSLRAAGKRIGERLIAMINQSEPAAPEQELWKVELVVRASTGPAPT
ncbi:LacI family DNA-binding transcriptional regulator [Rhizobium rosettiformans]|uniref:LacI family transcriptional regulator n=2 Tax=Rhizobium rosettiformans TaxID=1368430 RepID=A0A4S8PTY1_9HYPH|nr:substrate-binding domain-containing protein [Rhizobium rosettiformans]MBA4795878.1 substrate-binding domain-containing protein [Hyphomicrobiales bacterium]MBB5277458.1 LacI family transcriptional regulator [Rhizobium rosettiformans]MDR7028606.1 LacI family transcriptional regulator [Rhizobium rosettiformans]MDR7064112.1 LacI family transcriptional regulator [Rhizobium rosettiformans]THV33811.1 LacI family transcriptional regulator [Rhizobium rosettiformans W3]